VGAVSSSGSAPTFLPAAPYPPGGAPRPLRAAPGPRWVEGRSKRLLSRDRDGGHGEVRVRVEDFWRVVGRTGLGLGTDGIRRVRVRGFALVCDVSLVCQLGEQDAFFRSTDTRRPSGRAFAPCLSPSLKARVAAETEGVGLFSDRIWGI
jgi:hypothetical protein